MQGRYAAFTFVDRIVSFDPGIAARGTFHIPAGIPRFASSLLAEATGQLAAWAAMAKLDFRVRPVAGVAHETVYLGTPRPGDHLETEIRIDSCDDEAVSYQGVARIGGATVLELHDVVGPMLPAAEFDDPVAMREFLDLLLGRGASVDRFGGVQELRLVPLDAEAGRFASARLKVPAEAPFFADHFPRRPVLPGTLLLDCMTRLAAGVVAEARPGRTPIVRMVSDVKLRAFTEPGATLELRATLEPREKDTMVAVLEARAQGQKRPVGGARATFEAVR
jgi:3-hydroxymyristoyl/3-hydroxydecanoyl-(acyl carrier protein) dehydratase